jgi:WD40 repeat protein
MPSANKPASADRTLLAAGTASYDCPDFPALDKVPDALRDVVEALKGLGFTTVARPPGYRLDPALRSLRSAVRKAAGAAPVVVVYYTGHGADLERSTYYLVSKKSRPADLDESALAARDLLTLLTLRDDHGAPLTDQPTVLVILDCCYSGSAGMTMLGEELRGIGNPNTWVLASTGSLEYAQQGLFAKALSDTLLRPMAGPSQRFVSLEAIAQAINDAHAHQFQQQARVFSPGTGLTGIPPFFPNSYYQPSLAGMTVADQQHWLSRVRGGPHETTAGFYLTGKTGRLRAAYDLAEWMTDPAPKNLAVVTGSPGSGKSALLALPALLTEQSQRKELLRTSAPGSLIEHVASLLPVDAHVTAIHARGLNADQTAGAISQALRGHATTASGLLEAFETGQLEDGQTEAEQIVVVDAVDEAISPATLLGGLLIPLSRQPGIRVVIGARRHVLPEDADVDKTIDLDTNTYLDPKALIGYIHRLLVAEEEPGVSTCYQPNPGTASVGSSVAAVVAEGIAQRATASKTGVESFLIARLLALAVRDRSVPVDVTSPGWRSELPDGVAEAFDEDLARLGRSQPLARALLEALAWAKGPGLPWETIWVPLARALAKLSGALDPTSITNEGVRWLLDKAGAYVVEDIGPGQRSVFRPFHDLLARYLRGEPTTEEINSDRTAERNWRSRRRRVERTITEALLATVPIDGQIRRDWVSAHPYLRTYLAQHAADAGTQMLAALAQEMDFLAVADPTTLTPLLFPMVPELRPVARIYRHARPILSNDARANAAYLQEASRTLIAKTVPADTGIRPLYVTQLGSVRRDDSLLTLAGHSDMADSVAFGTTADGRILLASIGGDEDRTVRLWDPVTGHLESEPFDQDRKVYSVAFGTTADGRLLLASGGGAVELWDPVAGHLVGGPLAGRSRGVNSVAFGTTADGRLLLASGGDKVVQLWDPVAGETIGEPLTVHTSWVISVAFGTTADGRLLLASAGGGTLWLWDPLTGHPIGEPLTGLSRGWISLAFGAAADGRLLLAFAGDKDPTVRLWDPVTGHQVGQLLVGYTSWRTSVAFGTTADGRLLLASAGDGDRTVQLWDPVTGSPAGEPLTGHSGGVISVAFASTADGRLLLASGATGGDGTVRLWDPVTGSSAGEPLSGHSDGAASVAFGTTADGRLLLASANIGGQAVQLWDPATGSPAGGPLTGHSGRVSSVAFGATADGRLLLASASIGGLGMVQLWDPVTGQPIGELFTGHRGADTSVAFGATADGRLLLASASSGDHAVQLWDPVTGDQLDEPFADHSIEVPSVAFGTTADGRLLLASANTGVVGSVWLWDPVTGHPVGEPLARHLGWVTSVAFGTTADGRLLLASGGDDREVELWDPVSNVWLTTLRRRSTIWSVSMHGQLLAIGDNEGVCVIRPDLDSRLRQ